MSWLYNTLALAVTGLIGFLYLYGIDNSLFWRYDWYDAPLHILGGVVIGLWGSAVLSRISLRPLYTTLAILLFALVVGGGWEVFERLAGLTSTSQPGYWIDTLQDVFCDIGGALAVMSLYWALHKPRHE